jgi:hypothetical protein
VGYGLTSYISGKESSLDLCMCHPCHQPWTCYLDYDLDRKRGIEGLPFRVQYNIIVTLNINCDYYLHILPNALSLTGMWILLIKNQFILNF